MFPSPPGQSRGYPFKCLRSLTTKCLVRLRLISSYFLNTKGFFLVGHPPGHWQTCGQVATLIQSPQLEDKGQAHGIENVGPRVPSTGQCFPGRGLGSNTVVFTLTKLP